MFRSASSENPDGHAAVKSPEVKPWLTARITMSSAWTPEGTDTDGVVEEPSAVVESRYAT
jgi:hypothetical protein